MGSTEYDRPFWVVSSAHDGKSRVGFVRGYATEDEAKASAEERTKRGKELQLHETYRVVPKVKL